MIAKEELKGLSVQSVVENALARVILQLGGLRVGIVGEGTNQPCFVDVASMNLCDFMQWKTVAAASQVARDEHVSQLFTDRLEQLWPDIAHRPPWKLLVLEFDHGNEDDVVLEMLFAVHHAIADGKSTSVFHSRLLQALNTTSGPPPELQQHVLSFTQPPVLAPSQEELVRFTTSWPFFLKTLWQELLCPSWLKSAPTFKVWSGKPVALEPHKVGMRLVTIQAAMASGLISACRTHGVTLTGIVHILVLASFARRVQANTASAFSCETSISLRPWAKLPPGLDMDIDEVLADLATSHYQTWEPETVSRLRFALDNPRAADGQGEKLVWDLATAWRTAIKAKVASIPNDDPAGLMGYVSDWNKRWLACIGKPRDWTWDIANVGSINGVSPGSESDWSIRRSLFAQPAKVAGPALGVGMAGIQGGDVTLTFTWQETIIETEVVDGLVEDFGTWLQHFERTGRFGIFEQHE